MIRLLAAGPRIALVVAAMAVPIPVITFAQTPESATESELRERMAHLEGLLEGVREAIAGRAAAG